MPGCELRAHAASRARDAGPASYLAPRAGSFKCAAVCGFRVLDLEHKALRDAWSCQRLALAQSGALGDVHGPKASLLRLDPGVSGAAAAALSSAQLILPEQQPQAVALLERLGEYVQAMDDWHRGEVLRPKAGEPGGGETPRLENVAVATLREVIEQVRRWLGRRGQIC